MASIETNLNQSPFFDDFNEDKNFHRVLFRPGYAVQARELTQLQSILQNQVERFGDEVLDNGTILNGCDVELQQWNYVKLRDKNANNTILSLSQFFSGGSVANCVIEGQTTGINARVLDIVDGSEGNAPNYLTAFVSYLDSGTDNVTKSFADNEVLVFRGAVGNTFIAAANTINSSATGVGLGASATEGVVYHKGNFIRSKQQSGAVSKYTTTPTIRVGFETIETIVDSNQDSSLLDNASGATNFTAPGASRLKISTKIKSKLLTDDSTAGFFPVMDIQEGRVIRLKTTGYGDLDDEMAKRTYEESGDYALNPFVVRVEEHLRTDNNNGVYGASQSGDRDKLVVEVEPSVGYVRGYRTELTDLVRVEIDKAKEFEVKNDIVVGQAFGNYVICDEVAGTWDFQGIREIELYDGIQQAVTQNRFSNSAGLVGSKIGTANIRGFQYHSGRSGSPDGKFRLYLFNIDMNDGKTFSQVKSVIQQNPNNKKSRADVIQEGGVSKLKDTSLTSLIFPLQSTGVKTLQDGSGSVQTQYVFRTETTGQFNSSGDATITANTAHAGTNQSNDDTGNSPSLSSTDALNLIVVAQQDVTTSNKTGTVAQNGSTITNHGSTTAFTTDYSVGDYITVGSNNPQLITAIVSDSSMTVATTNTYTGGLAHVKFMPAGYIFNSADLTFVSTSSQHQIQLNEGGLSGGFNASVYFDVLRTQCQPDKKVVRKDRYVHINTGSHSESKAGPWSLGVPDGAEIKAVYMGSNTGVTTADELVTTEFRIDDGQRDSMYDIARLVKNPTSKLDLTNKGLLVKFNYFDRDRTAGVGFLTVDSYPVDDSNPDAADKIATAEIQRFTASNGRFFDLRDSVDFRPIKELTATPSTTGTAAAAPTNPGLSANFNTLSAGAHLPTPDKNFQADVQRYLPRMDIVSIRQNGVVDVKKGASSESPSLPMQDDNTMTLAGIYIPPYPSLSPESATFYGRPSYEVLVNPRDNRRFTMADLRQLESTVEENTNLISLNAFEIDALKNSVLRPDDPIDSAEPPKNSITLDPRPAQDASNTLRSSDLSFVRNPMRAIPTLQDIELELKSNSGVRVGNNKVTMVPSGYGELVSQVFATGSRTVSVKTETPAKTWNGQMALKHPVCAIQQIAEPISVVSSAPATSSSSPSYGGGYGYNWSGNFTIGGGWLSYGGGLGF